MLVSLYQDKGDERPLPTVRYWIRRILLGKSLADAREEHILHAFVQRVIRRFVSEFIGTLFLVLFIAGIQLVDIYSATDLNADDVNLIEKGITGGFVLAGLIYAFGGASGAHFNPVVTMAFFLRGVFDIRRIPLYWTAQFGGAITAAAILYGLFGNIGGLGTTVPSTSNGMAFGTEILITFILVTVILGTTEKAEILGPQSALAVGSVFTALLLFAWNISGGSANPFRTLGPTIISGTGWNTIWIYIVGPIVGMLIAVLVQRLIAHPRNLEAEQVAVRGSTKPAPTTIHLEEIKQARRESLAGIGE